MREPKILIEEVSPDGNLLAYVEETETCCHLYLSGKEGSSFGMKACWIRNLKPAPQVLEVEKMREGESPLLPAAFCRHPQGAPPIDPGSLGFIWAEEGDAVALTLAGDIVAIIPGWSGFKGFQGYARDCIGESPLCWELGTPETNAQFERYEHASRFWETFNDGEGLWSQLQEAELNVLQTAFGAYSNYYAIDGGNWPPKALVRITTQSAIVLSTIGVSIRPQPGVELSAEDPAPYRRMELGIGLLPSLADESVMKMASYLSAQAGYPWSCFAWLGHGHTLPSDTSTELTEGRLPFILLIKEGLGAPAMDYPTFEDDPINHLWMIPISEAERKLAEGTGSERLIAALQDGGVSWIADFSRQSVC